MSRFLLCVCLLLTLISACAPEVPSSTPEPTIAPTDVPAEVPTETATDEPMPEPTQPPALNLTEATVETPAETATETLTLAPTGQPSASPTATEPPTLVPAETATEAPTEAETEVLTREPATPPVTDSEAPEEPPQVTLPATQVAAAATAAPRTPLRFGVLPVMNALPLYVAEMERFYQQEGISVSVITFASAREREEAIQAGTIDGETTDMVSVVLLNNAGFEVQAVRWDTTVNPFFSIVVREDSNIETVNDLRNVPIAVANNTILAYMTRTLLLEAGFAESEIRLVNIPSIPRRMEALANGEVRAATLPEPLTAQAVTQQARVVATDADTSFVPTVLAFRAETLAERGDDVRAFLRAYERAVETINANPDAYRDLFVVSSSLPSSVEATYPVPQFREAGIASDAELDALIAWMSANNLMRRRLDNSAYVNRTYLP